MPKRILQWPTWAKILVVAALIFTLSSLYVMYVVLMQQDDIRVLQIEQKKRGEESIEINKTNNRILEIVLKVTSPESKVQSDARLNAAITKLDCNDQRTMQSVLDELSSQHGDQTTVIMTPECVQYFIDNPPATVPQ